MHCRHAVLTLTLALAMLHGVGCGDSAFIRVVVQADVNLDTADTLVLRVRAPDTRLLLERSYDLDAVDHDLPIVIVLEPSSDTPATLSFEAIAYERSQARAAAEASLRWKGDGISTVEITLQPLGT